MKQETLIASNQDKVILSEQEYQYLTNRSSFRINYESEQDLENTFIQSLISHGYQFFDITTFANEKGINHNDALFLNLREQLQKLNNYQFTDEDWKKFTDKIKNDILKDNEQKKLKSFIHDGLDSATLDFVDSKGIVQQICFLNKRDLHKNHLQVMHQYQIRDRFQNINNRYDVSILINGLPLVHVELKRRGNGLETAFDQIQQKYLKSMNLTEHLFKFVQLFIISNGTNTKYFANDEKTLQSIEFASDWTSEKNHKINDLHFFTRSFLNKNTLLKIITDYCVYTEESYDKHKQLIVMRPYQICAVEKILEQVNKSLLNKELIGKKEGGGYIWHTTGSGKTLTSFKAATLIKRKFPQIGKVVFVVDRQDLDYQTMKEYEKFEKDSVRSSSNTQQLLKLLRSEDENHKIIVTTIQKLNNLIVNDRYELDKNLKDKPIVFIFDECHRSQFGSQQYNIKKTFKNHIMFGFTGTPIFEQNANKNFEGKKLTTKDVFGKELHSYTIADSILDENTLPFSISYVNTFDKNLADNVYIEGIDESSLYLNEDRVNLITQHIISNFNTYTLRDGVYKHSLQKFTAMLATSSIKAAKMYYECFKKHQSDLKIAIIYSAPSKENINNEVDTNLADEDNDSANNLKNEDKEFLSSVIVDYNKIFGMNHTIEKFNEYYKDISQKVKSSEIDLLIVVNMFLTGFDSKHLNTLFVDKRLQYHGLIQAYSRTNRTVDTRKKHGNVVCYRNLQQEIEEAISLFGNTDTRKILISKTFDEAYEEYKQALNALITSFPLYNTQVVFNEKTEEKEIEFINLIKVFLNKKQKIKSYPEFIGKEIISQADEADYMSFYRDLEDKYKRKNKKHLSIVSSKEVTFETNLAYVTKIDATAIFNIILKYKQENPQNVDFNDEIRRLLNNHPDLRSKRELIKDFMNKEKMFVNQDQDSSYKTADEVLNDFNNFTKDSLKEKVLNVLKNGLITPKGNTIEFKDNVSFENMFNILDNKVENMDETKFREITKPVKINFYPTKEDLEKFEDIDVRFQVFMDTFIDLKETYF